MTKKEKMMLNAVNRISAEAFQYYQNNGGHYDDKYSIYRAEIRGALHIMHIATGKEYIINEDDGTISEK